MAKRTRNGVSIDISGFEELAKKLDSLGGNVMSAVSNALKDVQETVQDDTAEAVARSNLPAGGEYSKDRTINAIARNVSVEWDGFTASIPIGFDFEKEGAGGFLITGPPRMRPDFRLEDMYARKKYQKQVIEWLNKAIKDQISDLME